jgi:hypothetical protein
MTPDLEWMEASVGSLRAFYILVVGEVFSTPTHHGYETEYLRLFYICIVEWRHGTMTVQI